MADGEKCNNVNCRTIVTEIRKKDGQYKKYCSLSCRRLGVVEKAKQTSLERYGVSNPSKSKEIKQRIKDSFTEKYGEGITNAMDIPKFIQKIKDTNIERYGTDKPQLLEQFENKSKQTCLDKYGVEKPQRLRELKDKSKQTCLERYSGNGPQCNEEIRFKSIATCIEKYGVDNVAKLPAIWEKIKVTSIKKYGVESPNQNPDIHRKQDGSRYRNKEFVFPSGKIVLVQGYEPLALTYLLAHNYHEDDLLTETSDMPDINYIYNNKIHRYFSDIYIKQENLIIEVKSTYTFDKDKIKNLAKQQASLLAGYKYKFMIFNGRGNIQENYENHNNELDDK
jgi:hypothetical protein